MELVQRSEDYMNLSVSDVTEHRADVAIDCLKLPQAPCYILHKDFVAAIRSDCSVCQLFNATHSVITSGGLQKGPDINRL